MKKSLNDVSRSKPLKVTPDTNDMTTAELKAVVKSLLARVEELEKGIPYPEHITRLVPLFDMLEQDERMELMREMAFKAHRLSERYNCPISRHPSNKKALNSKE